jgi:hypothetical protein
MSGEPGVRCVEPDLGDTSVHRYQGGDYALEDIPELFQLGRIVSELEDPSVRLALRADEIRELKVMADAYSFDFEVGLIDLCVDLYRFASERRERAFVFLQEF